MISRLGHLHVGFASGSGSRAGGVVTFIARRIVDAFGSAVPRTIVPGRVLEVVLSRRDSSNEICLDSPAFTIINVHHEQLSATQVADVAARIRTASQRAQCRTGAIHLPPFFGIGAFRREANRKLTVTVDARPRR